MQREASLSRTGDAQDERRKLGWWVYHRPILMQRASHLPFLFSLSDSQTRLESLGWGCRGLFLSSRCFVASRTPLPRQRWKKLSGMQCNGIWPPVLEKSAMVPTVFKVLASHLHLPQPKISTAACLNDVHLDIRTANMLNQSFREIGHRTLLCVQPIVRQSLILMG